MTQTRDLIKKMVDFFTGEEFYEKGEDARLKLSPDDVRCMCYIIKQKNKTLEQEICKYCHEDRDGYVRPLEKNCHAFIRFGMDGWELSLHAKGWHGSAKIKYCPICGRELKNGFNKQTGGA